MELVLIVFGVGCLVGAIVGGGVRVRQQDSELQVPLVASRSRQALLALLGVTLMAWGGYRKATEEQRSVDAIKEVMGVGSY